MSKVTLAFKAKCTSHAAAGKLQRNKLVFRSQGGSLSNLSQDNVLSVESHSKTRWTYQPYLIAVGCVCVCVHIRFHYKNRLPDSICAQCAEKLGKQASLRLSVLLLPPTSPNCVWRQEIGVRPQSEGHVAMVYTRVTSDLFSPPPSALSHHSPSSETVSPEPGPENKTRLTRPNPARLGLTQSSRMDTLRFIWLNNEKQMDTEHGTKKKGEKKGYLVKYLWKKKNQGHCLIISICLMWFCWGGHVVSTTPRFIFHMIWSWVQSKRRWVDFGSTQ